MSDRPDENATLEAVAFGRDGLPFQVFVREGKRVLMYDFDWSEYCRTIHWHCSGAGFERDGLYLEHPTLPYWTASGKRIRNAQGPRLLNLPPAFVTLEQVFACGHEGDGSMWCSEGWPEVEAA